MICVLLLSVSAKTKIILPVKIFNYKILDFKKLKKELKATKKAQNNFHSLEVDADAPFNGMSIMSIILNGQY